MTNCICSSGQELSSDGLVLSLFLFMNKMRCHEWIKKVKIWMAGQPITLQRLLHPAWPKTYYYLAVWSSHHGNISRYI